MRRNAVSVIKFLFLCLVFATTPFMISWTLNFFFPIDDYPVDYMMMTNEEIMLDSDALGVEKMYGIDINAYIDHDSHEDVFDPRVYMIQNPASVDMLNSSSAEQELVDYIAENLIIHYDILDNFAHYAFYEVKLTLRNKGSRDIDRSEWAICLFHFNFIEPKHMKTNHSALIGDLQWNVTHIDGSLYKMFPTEHFQQIRANETREIIMTNGNSMVARSDAFPNWYVTARNTQPRIIKSTEGDPIKFLGDFDSPGKWKRSSADLFDPYTPEQRYFLNADAHDFGQTKKLVLPTPFNLTVREEMLDLGIGGWSISHDSSLVMEANVLSGQMDLPIDENAKINLIRLQIGDVSLPLESKLQKNEAYSIQMDTSNQIIKVTGVTAAAVFYGIQTLLSVYNVNSKAVHVIEVTDAPRFAHRGLMLDVARNFFPVYEVVKILDSMAMYKLNVLHFHLTDDQGWRLEIPGLEELTRVGSRRHHNHTLGLAITPSLGSGPFGNNTASGFYSVQEYRMILRHAKSRHITVVPEFDMPGHSNAAMDSMEARYRRLVNENLEEALRYRLIDPDDKSEYYAPGGHRWTTVNPCIDSTYNFVEHVMTAVKAMHQDVQPLETFHMGGDEVPKDALSKSPLCEKFRLRNLQYNSSSQLRQYFVRRVAELAAKHQLKLQAWEDAVQDENLMPFDLAQFPVSDLTCNMWNSLWELGRGHRTAVYANQGYKVILSQATHLYFDHPQEPDPEERGLYWARRYIDTRKTFSFQPDSIYDNMDEDRLGKKILKSDACAPGGMVDCVPLVKAENVIGMQGQIWGELLRTTEHLESMLYPRLLALAERAWHKASWEGISDEHVRERLRLEDWESFANTLGHKELSRLEAEKIQYYLPPPGAVVTNGEVKVNTAFPGLAVQSSIDGGLTWSDVQPGQKFDAGTILLATRSHNLVRQGRPIKVEIA